MGKADLLLGSLVRQNWETKHTYLPTYIHTYTHTHKEKTDEDLLVQLLRNAWCNKPANGLIPTLAGAQEEEGRKGGREEEVCSWPTNWLLRMNEWMNAYMLPASVTSLWKSRVSHPAEIQVFSVWNSLLGLTQLYNNPHPKDKFITFTLRVVVDGLGFWWGKNLLDFFLVYSEV
jgi:hypothetical protein